MNPDDQLRSTYADLSAVRYQLRAAAGLLGVSENTLRTYSDMPEFGVQRATKLNPRSPAVRLFTPANLFAMSAWRRESGLINLKRPARPRVITVDLIKGGVGKTTTAVETVIHLQLMGFKCLLVDLDIQGNATQMLGYEPDLTLDEAKGFGLTSEAIVVDTMASVMVPYIERSRPNARQAAESPSVSIKRPFGEAGPHLLPADPFLGDMEQALTGAYGGREVYIKRMLDDSANGRIPWFDIRGYDVIVFDCPPSISFTTSAALAAADIVLAPIRLDAFSVKGLSKLHSELAALDTEYAIRPELCILPTHYAAQLSRMSRMQAQLQPYADKIVDCAISASEDLPRSLDSYMPLTIQRPTSQSAKEYRQLAEILKTKLVSRGDA